MHGGLPCPLQVGKAMAPGKEEGQGSCLFCSYYSLRLIQVPKNVASMLGMSPGAGPRNHGVPSSNVPFLRAVHFLLKLCAHSWLSKVTLWP